MQELKQIKATGGATGQVATVQANGSMAPGDFTGVLAAVASKGWINFKGTGTVAIRDSFNVTSITDNGLGDYTITWDIDFDNVNYAVVPDASSGQALNNESTQAVGSAGIQSRSPAGTLSDAGYIGVMAFGDMVNLSVGGSAPGVKVDSLCKGWITLSGTGTIAINDSFNVTSITDNNTGDYTVNWDVDFDNANYCVNSTALRSGGLAYSSDIFNIATGSIRALTVLTGTGNAVDANGVMIQAFGDNPIALSREAGFLYGDVGALIDAVTVAPDSRNGDTFTLATTQNFTLNTPTNVPVGKSYKCDIFITQDATGSRILTVGTGWLVDSAVDPILTIDASAVDWLVATYDGSRWFLGLGMGDAS